MKPKIKLRLGLVTTILSPKMRPALSLVISILKPQKN